MDRKPHPLAGPCGLPHGSRLKFVAHAPYRLDQVAFIAHLRAELLDVGIYRAGVAEVVVVPYVIEDFLA